MFTGVAPIAANATNTVALWVGVTASTGAYRKHLDISRRVMVPLAVISLIGGIAGAYLLLHTPAQTFLRVMPWLMLGATLLFMFGKRLSTSTGGSIAADASTSALAIATVFELIVAVYGGYFGGGVGILNLAMLAALGMTDIHAMNALKVVLGGIINGVAVITFVIAGAVVWKTGLRHDRRSTLRRILRRPLRSKASWRVDPRFCHRSGNGNDGVFLLEGLPLKPRRRATFVICPNASA